MIAAAPPHAFHHEALLYEGGEDFVRRVAPFVRDGVHAGEEVMVAVTDDKIALLREALGTDGAAVRFEDMAEMGRNPARIIPAWRDFAADAPPGRALRGVGEPIWAARCEDELVECQLHESLLNLAFRDVRAFRLLCPYDVSALDEAVIHEARCSHPHVGDGDATDRSRHYRGEPLSPSDAPLPPPPATRARLSFEASSLGEVRELAAEHAAAAGIDAARCRETVLAVHEIATNSVRHGGGAGVLHIWHDDGHFVAEVRDRGTINDALVGRQLPTADDPGGWGCYVANQLADLVQVRSGPHGTVVRLHVYA